MDVPNILPQIDRLDGELDTLDEVLKPLLGSVSEVASQLPLLDKAKLYVLITYSIESMLFSSLRLNSVDAKNHPVFKELTRVRQYFEKIKNIENPPAPEPPRQPEQTLNKEAAIRFLRADLADDKQVNAKLTEMIAKERAKSAAAVASAKAAKLAAGGSSKRGAEEDSGENGADATMAGAGSAQQDDEPPAKKSKKKDRKDKKTKKGAK